VSFRCGYADEHARARWTRPPGILREAVGASYQECSNLAAPLGMVAADGFALPTGARATAWADGLEPEGATPLATYDHPHFGRFAAATTHRFGQGQVTYVGTLPDPAFGRAVAVSVLQRAGMRSRWADLPPSAHVTGASTKAGRRLWFVSNWAWEPATVPTPVAGVSLLSGRGVQAGGSVELGAWDVDIIAET
jgi:beta-galactosidase